MANGNSVKFQLKISEVVRLMIIGVVLHVTDTSLVTLVKHFIIFVVTIFFVVSSNQMSRIA